MSRTQEIPRGQIDPIRASTESLPSYSSSRGHSQGRDFENNQNPSRHGSRDHLDSDYHSNAEDNGQGGDFHGNVYPVPNSHCQGQSQHSQGHYVRQTSHGDNRSDISDRDNVLRKSIEDFEKFKEAYHTHQLHPHQGQGHEMGYYSDSNVPTAMASHPHYSAAEQPYEHGHYHYYHEEHMQGHQVHQGHSVQGHMVHHHGYGDHYHDNGQQHSQDPHHHFRNIYSDRPYQTIGAREETEGENVLENNAYYHGHPGYDPTLGFHGNTQTDVQETPNQDFGAQQSYAQSDQGYFSRVRNKASTILENTTQQIANSQLAATNGATTGRKLPQVKYRVQNVGNDGKVDQKPQDKSNSNNNVSNKESNKRHSEGKDRTDEDNYRVKYSRDSGGSGNKRGHDKQTAEDTDDDREFVDKGLIKFSNLIILITYDFLESNHNIH